MIDIVYDVVIIGGGAAGVMAALEIAASTNLTVCLLEKAKRLNDARNIGYCWLGASARSHARLYSDPTVGGSGFTDDEFSQFSEFMNHFHGSALKYKTPKFKKKFTSFLESEGFKTITKPVSIVTEEGFIRIADRMYLVLKKNINIVHKCDVTGINKVFDESKKEDYFKISTTDFEYKAKKVIVSTGRSSQGWFEGLDKNFSVPYTHSGYEFGIRLEMPSVFLDREMGKDFEAKLRFGKNEEWTMTAPIKKMNVETEEVGDLKISNSRQSSHGKKTYASFAIMHRVESENSIKEVERLVGLSNILSDGQLSREPTAKFLAGESQLNAIKEYALFSEPIKMLSKIMPTTIAKSNIYTPEARLNIRKYNLKSSGEIPVGGCFLIGDMTGHQRSFVQAAISGLRCANSIIETLPEEKKKKKEVYDYASIEAVRGSKKRDKEARAAIGSDSIGSNRVEADGRDYEDNGDD